MDRPSQEPPERPGPPAEAAESPLSFPVEVASPVDASPVPVEAAPADPLVPGQATSSPADPLSFPVEAPADPLVPGQATSPPADPLNFPAEAAPADPFVPEQAASPPADPLSFPVEAAPPPAYPAAAASADPLAFPTPAPPLADPLFPAQATRAPHPPDQLPFPLAELPGGVTAVPPPLPAAEPAPTPAAETPAGLLRFLPPLLTAVAALMTVGGCFFPLVRLQQHVSVRQRFFEAQLTITETAWGRSIEIPGQDAVDQGGSPVGIPLILAALVLATAAFRAFSRPERGRWLIAAGAFFTTGVVITVGMSGVGWSGMAETMNLEVVTAAGMWLLIGATVLVAVAAVLAYLPVWRRGEDDWADPTLAYADTPTPPTGVAITVLPPDEPGQPRQPG